MENLEELIIKRENLYKELVQLKNRKKDLITELYELKKQDSIKMLQFLHCDNQIAVLELYNQSIKKVHLTEDYHKKFDNNSIGEDNKKVQESISDFSTKQLSKKEEKTLENKTIVSNEDFDKFQDEYYKSFRSMLSLAITDNTARMLSKMPYQDWMIKKDDIDILLQKSGRADTYRGKEIEKVNQVYCIVAPPKDINFSEVDVVKNALDKFFDIDGNLLPNNVKQQHMEIIMPAVFLKRSDEYYELKQKGSLKFE